MGISEGGQRNAARATVETTCVAGPLEACWRRGSFLGRIDDDDEDVGGSGRPPRKVLACGVELSRCDGGRAIVVLTATLVARRIVGGDCGAIIWSE